MRVLYKTLTAAAAAALALAAGPAGAQDLEPPQPRQGYYMGLGILNGVSHNWEDGEGLGTWPGGGFTVRLGQKLTRRLGLGLQITSASSRKGDQNSTLFGLGLEGQLELAPRLAVHAGAGLGVLQLHDNRVMNEELRGAYGAEYMLGASYAFFPYKRRHSGGLSITPMLQARILPEDAATSFSVLGGVELGWWTGLPRNQLDLPPADAFEK